ncbi:MAG: endonuclease domain-containing protein [Pseudomonadota bacterium]
MAGYTQHTLENAKRLRRHMTDAEKLLWHHLRNAQICQVKFRRQQPIGRYIADFVSQERRLIVEADGGHHMGSDHDLERDAWLQRTGYTVLRFSNIDILTNIEGVVARLVSVLDASPSPTTPRPQAAKASYPLPPGERGTTGDTLG